MTNYNDPDQWSERQTASFRGVEFGFVSTKGKTGRRALPHEYPKRDLGWTEDHGGVLNNETINAILVGESAEADFLRLLSALNVAGPGELVHPFFGTQLVQIGEVDYDFDNNERHKATLSFKVYSAGENLFPAQNQNTNAEVLDKCDASQDAIASSFADGMDESFLDSISDTFNSALDDLDSLVMGLPQLPDDVGTWINNLDLAKGSIGRLLAYPGEVMRDVTNAIFTVKDLVTTIPTALNVYDQLINRWTGFIYEMNPSTSTSASTSATTTSNESKEHTYQHLVASAIIAKAEAIANAPVTGMDAGFNDSGEASEANNLLIEQLQTLAETAIEQNQRGAWRAYRQLRIALNDDMAVRIQQLPQLNAMTPNKTMPVALLAYKTTGDTHARDEMVKRNRLSRPSFITPNQRIEYIKAVNNG